MSSGESCLPARELGRGDAVPRKIALVEGVELRFHDGCEARSNIFREPVDVLRQPLVEHRAPITRRRAQVERSPQPCELRQGAPGERDGVVGSGDAGEVALGPCCALDANQSALYERRKQTSELFATDDYFRSPVSLLVMTQPSTPSRLGERAFRSFST